MKKKKKFPDISGDGKITKKDILMARGVIKKKKSKKKGKKWSLKMQKWRLFLKKNPFPNTKVASTAEQVFSPFVVKDNKRTGPQGQTSRMQIKKVAFKGVK